MKPPRKIRVGSPVRTAILVACALMLVGAFWALEASEPVSANANASASDETFIGTRTDDGMDYMTFDVPRTVEAPRGEAEVYEFHGRLENLPIPEPESGDNEILSGICVLGVWNDHLVKSRDQSGPPLLVKALEFEAPYHPVWPLPGGPTPRRPGSPEARLHSVGWEVARSFYAS